MSVTIYNITLSLFCYYLILVATAEQEIREMEVSSTGSISREYPEMLGTYHLAEIWHNDQAVYEMENAAGHFFLIYDDECRWEICRDLDGQVGEDELEADCYIRATEPYEHPCCPSTRRMVEECSPAWTTWEWYDMDAEEWLPDFETTVTATVSCNGCEVDADCGDEALAETRAVWCREDNCCGSIFDNLDPSNIGPF